MSFEIIHFEGQFYSLQRYCKKQKVSNDQVLTQSEPRTKMKETRKSSENIISFFSFCPLLLSLVDTIRISCCEKFSIYITTFNAYKKCT